MLYNFCVKEDVLAKKIVLWKIKNHVIRGIAVYIAAEKPMKIAQGFRK